MKSAVKKIKNCKMKLTVEVEPELVEGRFQEVFRDFQKAVSLPGFRQGKAPSDLIEKKFLKEAQEEVLKSLIPEAYHRSVASQKLSPVSLPSISEIQVERGKKLSFSAEFENSPEFSLKNYKGIKINKPSTEVSADEVEKGFASLLDSRAELVQVAVARPAAQGDFVIADVEVWKDGAYVEGRKGTLLSVEPHPGDDFFEKIIGANINEVREISIEEKPAYKIWVRNLKEKKLPEVNEEFAKSFGKDTIEELKTAVRKDIAAYKLSESHEKMKHDLFDRLLALVEFEVPEGLVEKQKEKLLDQAKKEFERMGRLNGRMEDEMKKVEGDASVKAKEQVKLYFILQKVAELESVEADEVELEKKLTALAEESKRPLDEARRVFEDDLRESMREKQTVEFLLANAKLEETNMSA